MTVALLDTAYAALAELVCDLDDAESWEPTGCRGWVVRDLAFHVTCDAQRALVALHTPTEAPADRNAVTYWQGWGDDPDADADGRRWTRVSGSMFGRWEQLRDLHAETAAAVRHAAAAADPDGRVRTQGHVLTVADLASTLAVEATLHHLDLVRHLPRRSGPAPAGLAEVRRVVEALVGPFPTDLDDERVALVGTGRADPGADEAAALGDVLPRLPAFS